MAPQIFSPANPPPPPSQGSTDTPPPKSPPPKPPSSLSAFLSSNRYPLLVSAYVLVTSVAFWRVHRQPYPPMVKREKYSSIFKGTTITTAVVGVGLYRGWDWPILAGKRPEQGKDKKEGPRQRD